MFSGAKATMRTIRTMAIKYHGGVKDEGGGKGTRLNNIYLRQLHNKIEKAQIMRKGKGQLGTATAVPRVSWAPKEHPQEIYASQSNTDSNRVAPCAALYSCEDNPNFKHEADNCSDCAIIWARLVNVDPSVRNTYQ